MTHKIFSLPEYPVSYDLWDKLRDKKRPIVIYGMGNGADKLLDRFSELGIVAKDIFASDGFVRGHEFHGIRVKSFSEIKSLYDDFVIVLSFASNREEVLEMLTNINESYEMYIPDMPVCDVSEYFDKDYYNTHYSEILSAYEALSDEYSRSLFSAIINFKLSGKMSYLTDIYSTREEMYSSFDKEAVKSIIDVGAYNGDTVREAIEYFPSLESVVAIEPDKKNYKRLKKFVDSLGSECIEIRALNSAAWSHSGEGEFQSSGNRNSSISSTSSYENKDIDVSLISIDSLGLTPDYIKYDVEGAELEALIGTDVTINRCRPTLLVSLYHRSKDIFFLINYLHEKYPFYKLRLHRLKCVPAWEINLILTT